MKFPQRGEIHWAKIIGQPGDTKERSVLVVSSDSRNQFADDVIVVPLSTTLRPAPTHVYPKLTDKALRTRKDAVAVGFLT